MKYEKLLCATRTTVTVAAIALTATVMILTMPGCGGSSSRDSNGGGGASIAEGNWSIAGASTAMPGSQYRIGGHVVQSGNTLTGKVSMIGPCDHHPTLQALGTVALTGSVSGNQFTFAFGPTSSASSVQGTFTGTGTSLQSLTGSFTVSGGCASGDQVTATATLSPPLSGTWTGTGSATAGEPDVSVSITFTQTATPSADGTYLVSGTLDYNSSTCTANGAELLGYVAGSNEYFTFDEAGIDPVWFGFTGSLDSPPSTSTFTGSYQTLHGFSTIPGCEGDVGTIQFTKQ